MEELNKLYIETAKGCLKQIQTEDDISKNVKKIEVVNEMYKNITQHDDNNKADKAKKIQAFVNIGTVVISTTCTVITTILGISAYNSMTDKAMLFEKSDSFSSNTGRNFINRLTDVLPKIK